MCLSLCTRSKSDARDSVTSHDGNAVGREGPLISKRTSFSHFLGFCVTDTLFAVKVLVSILQSLGYLMILRDNPCREVALDWICAVLCRKDGRSSYMETANIIAIFLNSRKGTDLIQAAFPCFSGMSYDGQEILQQESATAQRLGEVKKDLGYSYSTAS